MEITTVNPSKATAAAKPVAPTAPVAPRPKDPPKPPSAQGHIVATKLRVSLDVDRDTNRVIATITDPKTGEVVDQLPPEHIVKLAASVRAMLRHVVDEHA